MPPEPHLQPGNALWDDESNRAEPGGIPVSQILLREPRARRQD